MSKQAENRLVERIRWYLKLLGAKSIKVHGNGYTEIGTPDVLACLHGRFLALEVKMVGECPTPIQEERLTQWEAVGAIAGCVHSEEEVKALLRIKGIIK